MSGVIVAEGAVVCDASVFAAVAFGEPGTTRVRAVMRARRLLAPPLLRYELAQVAVTKCARRPDEAALVEQQFLRSLRVPIRLVEPSWAAVVGIARENGLSAYDAAYLQLALELRVPLATLDERLGQVAEKLGIRAG